MARWANLNVIPAAGISTTCPGTRHAGSPAQRDDVTVAAVTLTELDGKLAAARGGAAMTVPQAEQVAALRARFPLWQIQPVSVSLDRGWSAERRVGRDLRAIYAPRLDQLEAALCASQP